MEKFNPPGPEKPYGEVAGQVPELDIHNRGEHCRERYESIVSSFRELFIDCSVENSHERRYGRDLKINTYEDHDTKAYARITPTSPVHSSSGVDYRAAQGFIARFFVVVEGESHQVEYDIFSIGHRGQEKWLPRIFGKPEWWDKEAVEEAEGWLSEFEPKAEEVLERLYAAAANENLNPHFSELIRKAQADREAEIAANKLGATVISLWAYRDKRLG